MALWPGHVDMCKRGRGVAGLSRGRGAAWVAWLVTREQRRVVHGKGTARVSSPVTDSSGSLSRQHTRHASG